MLGHPRPAESDPAGESFTFDKPVGKVSGGKGYADVWKRGFFAWEYKGPHKNLNAAYLQLLEYREALENPPLLVVCDMNRFEVHTNFENTKKRIFAFDLDDLKFNKLTPDCSLPPLDVLRYVFEDPDELRPENTARRVTEEAAEKFCRLAESIELSGADPRRGLDRQKVAHFLMRLLFCLFADSIGLLPEHMFREMIEDHRGRPAPFQRKLRALFEAMANRESAYGPFDILYFNGGLFEDGEVLELNSADIGILSAASRLDWSTVAPSIFGTLFERSLNAEKRSQIGAHYTSAADIALIVGPVVMEPLRRRWADVRGHVTALAEQATAAAGGPAWRSLRRQMQERLVEWMEALGTFRILDPACGSGNFLYVALRGLLDLWWEARMLAADYDLAVPPCPVSPRQLLGIEIDYYAHELTSIVVWIGYLQWLHEHGVGIPSNPVLQKLENIRHGDAILVREGNGKPQEPEWPEAEFIVSNPPFLGGNKLRQELGDKYVDDLFRVYESRVPPFADLVCYWFEKARHQIEAARAKRAGLIGTQGIRGGVNRIVLERIKSSGGIFLAYSDRDWILDGANVHVSMVCFDGGSQTGRTLDGGPVVEIHANLTSAADTPSAVALPENAGICFMGPSAKGDFDIDAETARKMLRAPLNVNGRPNSDVVRPVCSGVDLVQRARGMWTIDFGTSMSEQEAAQYEYPFQYVLKKVKPARTQGRRAIYGTVWWRYGRPRVEMREALTGKRRYIATPATAKHRIFVWREPEVLCNQGTLVFAREDDYFFGVLHSRIHEGWALLMGTQLEDRPRYTPTSTFETFPFPWPPGKEPNSDPRVEAIAEAARELVRQRDNWLNPPGAEKEELKERTLTNLYNERPAWLEQAHARLDEAVFAAYVWPSNLTTAETVERLLALNHGRASVTG
jgi:type II restriction/modification system DNA methylase subunit YeeA